MAMRTPAWRDWTNLGSGPAALIANRLLANDVADYVRFRTVCAEWRACSDDPRGQNIFDRRYHPHRWIISVDGRRRRLLNVSTGDFINLRRPDRRRYFVLGPTSEGLLLLCQKNTLVVQLLNPLTGQATDLPPANFFPRAGIKLQDVRLLGAGMAGDSMVAFLFRDECSEQQVTCDDSTRLVVARPGGKSWIFFRTEDEILSAVPFAGRFYCATAKNVLVLQGTSSQNPRLVVVAKFRFDTSAKSYVSLADNDGKLMLFRCCPLFFGQLYKMREVYRVDLEARKTVAVRPVIHGRAVFVAPYDGRALSVRGGLSPSVSANTIYFCKRRHNGNPELNFDIWRLVDGSVEEDCMAQCTCNVVRHLTRHILGCW